MAMKYDFHGVETAGLSFGTICKNIEENNLALENLKKSLEGCFTGQAAEQGWQPKINEFLTKINEYQGSLATLKTTVERVVGDMKITDGDQGSKFLAFNI